MDLQNGESKQFLEIGGKCVLRRTLEIFNANSYINSIIISARSEDFARINEMIFDLPKVKKIVSGGENRLESVRNAIKYIKSEIKENFKDNNCNCDNSCDFIAVHDGARCFVSHEDIKKVAELAFESGAAAACTKINDTVKIISNANNLLTTFERENLRAVQTPQIFLRDLYIKALENLDKLKIFEAPDDCFILEKLGVKISLAECSRYNIKITDKQDLDFVNNLII